jgi:hypothetical protein
VIDVYVTGLDPSVRANPYRARRLGLTFGTGNVDATCESLFEIRLRELLLSDVQLYYQAGLGVSLTNEEARQALREGEYAVSTGWPER